MNIRLFFNGCSDSYKTTRAFTLVEVLMALLIVSIILSTSLPIMSQRQKAMASSYNKNQTFPIGGVILWTDMNKLPDNTWMECNGTAVPNGAEYEQARRIFGTNLPDLRNIFDYSTNLNNYLKIDLKNYLQTNLPTLPQNLIAIWGTNAAIPEGWSEATEYRGVFLRGYGSITHTQNNGSIIGNTATTHTSSGIGAVQGDAIRYFGGNAQVGFITDHAGSSSAPQTANSVLSLYGGSPITVNYTSSFSVWTRGIQFDSSKRLPTDTEIRPVNKAVRYIKYTNSASFPDLPAPPETSKTYRYIAKVRY